MALGKDKKLRKAFSSIREEFEMHLDSINTNTEEIFENRAMILELQERFFKLSDKLNDVALRAQRSSSNVLDGRQELIAALQAQDNRIKELTSKIDALSLQVRDVAPQAEREWPPIELTLREQEVFLSLYTTSDAVSYAQLSRHLSLPVSLVQDLSFSMIQKGVPIIKRYDEQGNVLVSLDIEFAELQSKRNIVGIDQNLSAQLSRELQLSLLQ